MRLRPFAFFFATGVVALSHAASAQTAPPPIDVPTTPVPQTPPPPPPTTPPKPKPAPPPAAPTTSPTTTSTAVTPTGGGVSPTGGKDDSKSEEPKSFNNEGVFKVTGAAGSGVVGGKGAKSTKATKGTSASTTSSGAAPKGKVTKVSTAIVAEWPGFRNTDDGGSEVMIEFSRPSATPTEHKAAGSITYIFKGAHVLKHNNQNPLLTMHFNTPVLSARLVPKKDELHLVIDLRPSVDVSGATGVRVGADAGGQQFFVKFGAGNYLPANDDDTDDGLGKKKKTKLSNAGTGLSPSTSNGPGKTTPSKPPSGKGPTP